MKENITCPKCRHRHPADRSCAEAKRLADQAREARERYYAQEEAEAKAEAAREEEQRAEAQHQALVGIPHDIHMLHKRIDALEQQLNRLESK